MKECEQSIICLWSIQILVWRLTIVIRTGNIKTEDQYWMNFISWKCWTGKRRAMAPHDILIAFSIISEHSTWGGGTIPRHGQCEHTVAAALACGSRRPPSIATPPPSHHSHLVRQSVCVMFRRILLYSSSSVPRYLIRELQLIFYLFDEIYESTKYFSKCIASTNWHSLTPHFFSGHPVLRVLLLGQGYSSNIIGVNIIVIVLVPETDC